MKQVVNTMSLVVDVEETLLAIDKTCELDVADQIAMAQVRATLAVATAMERLVRATAAFGCWGSDHEDLSLWYRGAGIDPIDALEQADRPKGDFDPDEVTDKQLMTRAADLLRELIDPNNGTHTSETWGELVFRTERLINGLAGEVGGQS